MIDLIAAAAAVDKERERKSIKFVFGKIKIEKKFNDGGLNGSKILSVEWERMKQKLNDRETFR